MKVNKLKYAMVVLLCCWGLTACIYDAEGDFPLPAAQHEVEFRIQTVATGKPTRAITGVDENHIDRLDLLVFNTSGNFLYAKTATSVSNSRADGSTKRARFKFTEDDIVENVRLMFIANTPEAQSVINGIVSQAPLAGVKSLFTVDCTSAWNTASSSDFQPIPLWGETGTVTVNLGDNDFTVRMIRALARLNLSLADGEGLPGVTLSSVDIYGYRSAACVCPSSGNFNGTEGKVTAPTVNANTPVASGSLTYPATDSNALRGTVYLAETDNPQTDRICLVVGLSREGSESVEYFRLDFVNSDNVYLPVLRNHTYNFNITGFSGVDGYTTKEEALKSTGENITYTLNVMDNSSHNVMVTDERYVLCMDKDHLTVPQAGGNAEWLVYTDVPSGWTIDDESFCVNGQSVSRPSDIHFHTKGMEDEVAKGITDLNYYLTVSLEGSPTARTITFNVIAGRISKTVEIKQE